ncbi:uncharacterized protein LOC123269855 [Cotesia glomerata]|nr:uncharacterized protein LOC123269855 [Cotesia glomerata]XP_044591677.1 uncharacterized protein LOC123269855 [Cotesia glomerata]XP_044591678.1 uncharacterized protein LOC123269855 [Cotesia glomerata]
MDNRAYDQSVPVDLRRGVPMELIQTENMMEYANGPVRQYASKKLFSVHGDFLNECSQVSKIIEDLLGDLAEDLGLRTSTGDHVSEEEHFGRINSQNVNKFRGLNVEIRDKVLPIEDNNNTSEARKQRIAKFTLPPDYDPNNSKWTLRYRYPKPELIELLRYSGLYVNAANLKHCNESATDCKSLAQLLMVEVFSDSALKVCSLTGAKAIRFRGIKTDVRPGLDKDARAILVRYVEIYGEKQGWCTEDHRAIINAMRNKLYSSRKKDRHHF